MRASSKGEFFIPPGLFPFPDIYLVQSGGRRQSGDNFVIDTVIRPTVCFYEFVGWIFLKLEFISRRLSYGRKCNCTFRVSRRCAPRSIMEYFKVNFSRQSNGIETHAFGVLKKNSDKLKIHSVAVIEK